ncbi:MAG: glycoside hydrolase family 32 protein [Bacteroidetes bacterium]|nr:glycoside hydrolase family 32 protein [Bacteroidota bacterium]
MRLYILLFAVLILQKANAQNAPFYQETFRPQFHFTPPIHWMNDPNGLVYHKGEYHLFYQFNPFGNRWGHMSWGHAVSKDLVYWQHLPLAIPEEKDTMIFSGSCVVDAQNTTGFATKPGEVPMVAIYTGHIEGKSQSQHIAYSLDDGRTWTKYNANPVLDLGKKDFRDPSVFWYAPQKKWVMSVVWPFERQVKFYSSPNLKDWQLTGSFGPAGDTSGIWECPTLFEVPVKDQPGKSKWVLMLSPAPYMQYFVGEFDGTAFRNDNTGTKVYRPDYGPDYYAAIVFNNLPAAHKPVSIGWVNNWNYANDIPTTPWKSAMSLPRELTVKKMNNEWTMLQEPVDRIESLLAKPVYSGKAVVTGTKPLSYSGQQWDMECEFTVASLTKAGVKFAMAKDKYAEIGYDAARKILYIDRTKAGEQDFNPAFAKQNRYETALNPINGKIRLHILYDNSIVEVYANEGETVMTAQLFPHWNESGIALFSDGSTTSFNKIIIRPMRSIW